MKYLSMFTGIIESLGELKKTTQIGDNVQLTIESPISKELSIDQSVSHNGVCLTVESVSGNLHTLTAVPETLKKTTLGRWQPGTLINLERCMKGEARFDGHIVQGHVDSTARLINKEQLDGSVELSFEFDEQFAPLVIEKGSLSLDGISLTLFNVGTNTFTVAIIPYTLAHTNLRQLEVSGEVNIEFDIVGKYISRFHQLKQNGFVFNNFPSTNA